MQRTYVYDTNENGHIPKLDFLKVLIIYTSGIPHDQVSRNYEWNSIENSYLELFKYMGASEVRSINVQGVDTLAKEVVEYRTEQIAKSKFNELALRWYGVDKGLLLYSKLDNRVLKLEKRKRI